MFVDWWRVNFLFWIVKDVEFFCVISIFIFGCIVISFIEFFLIMIFFKGEFCEVNDYVIKSESIDGIKRFDIFGCLKWRINFLLICKCYVGLYM